MFVFTLVIESTFLRVAPVDLPVPS